MTKLAELEPKTIEVRRSELRQEQRAILKKAVGEHIIVIKARTEDEEKYIVDKRYFESLLKKLRATVETLEIATDTRLFENLLRAAETIDADIRLGKLHSIEEAFE